MAGLIVNSGLDYLSGVNPATDSSNWVVHLYKSSHVPANTDTAGSYTESTFPGYASKTPGAWPTASASGGTKSYASPVMNFISTASGGGEQIFGYYVVNGSGTLLMAEQFASPITITAAGYGVQLSVNMQDANT